MFEEKCEKLFDECLEEVLNTNDLEIADLISKYYDEIGEEKANELIRKEIKSTLIVNFLGDLVQEDGRSFLIKKLNEGLRNLPLYKQSYTFDVSLEGLEKQVFRKIEVPALFTLEQLAYAIIAAMNGKLGTIFLFQVDDELYACELMDGESRFEHMPFANDSTLESLKLNRNSTMKLTIGNEFNFVVRFKTRNMNQIVQSPDTMKVKVAKGYGIWENHRDMVDLYYKDRLEYNERLTEIDEEIDYEKLEQSFSLQQVKENFTKQYYAIEQDFIDLMNIEED